MTKDKIVKELSAFFASKGVETMDIVTYKSYDDAPVNVHLIRRMFGSWNRTLSVLAKRYPVSVTPVEVVKAPKAKKKAKVEVESKDVE
jgi:hypothetical protein